MITADHLGGYTAGGDESTFFPDLWRWAVDELGVRSVLDVGCGEGHSVEVFDAAIPEAVLGVPVTSAGAIGIDGVPQPDARIFEHDYTLGPFGKDELAAVAGRERVDLIWCCEFVEHVEEKFVPNFLATFELADLILLTHAHPGQLGHHHVNCQEAAYWIDRLGSVGFDLDVELSQQTRALAARNKSPWNHYVRSGLAFRSST